MNNVVKKCSPKCAECSVRDGMLVKNGCYRATGRPVRDGMLVENIYPRHARSVPSGTEDGSSYPVPTGHPALLWHISFYQHQIPNGITTRCVTTVLQFKK
jgi:hypothetical protein